MTKPNIIIINPDQWRGDVLGHMGNPAAFTPNLDEIVQTDGVSFKNAFVQATVCTPSRCSFMSGWYPHVRGHRTMFHMMHDDEPVLLKRLKQEGYWVWWGGKNDLVPGDMSTEPYCHARSGAVKATRPNLHSDQRWRSGEETPGYYSFFAGCLDKGEEDIYMDGDWAVVTEAIEVIRRQRKQGQDNLGKETRPFCLYLALGYPHPPYGVEEPFYSAIGRTKLPQRIPTPVRWEGKPSILRGIWERQKLQQLSESDWTELRATYYGQCARVDFQIGLLLRTLKDAGMYDETAIFIFSDHGDYTGDYGLVEKNQNTFEDCLVRVPFVIKPPSWVPVRPRVSEALVELVDFPATIFDMLNLSPDYTHFGKSLLPVVAGYTDENKDAVFTEGGRLAGETHCMELESRGDQNCSGLYYPRLSLQREESTPSGLYHGKATMIRDKRYKYVQRLYEADELYDLKDDPAELVNRITDPKLAHVVARLKDRLLRFYQETGDVVPYKTDVR